MSQTGRTQVWQGGEAGEGIGGVQMAPGKGKHKAQGLLFNHNMSHIFLIKKYIQFCAKAELLFSFLTCQLDYNIYMSLEFFHPP